MNLIKADRLLKGEKMARKKRGLYLSAARSYMFNTDLSDRVGSGAWQVDKTAWLFGRSPHRDIEIPGLRDEFIDWGLGLEKLGVKAQLRELVAVPENLSWQLSGADLELSFSLPGGAYATSLVKELVNCDEKTGDERIVEGKSVG